MKKRTVARNGPAPPPFKYRSPKLLFNNDLGFFVFRGVFQCPSVANIIEKKGELALYLR